VLKRIAAFVENQEDLKSKVVGSLAYPVFLAFAGFSVVAVLMVFFIPKFEPIFEKLKEKGQMPDITTFLLSVSHFHGGYWWLLSGGVLAAFVGYRRWAATPDGLQKERRGDLEDVHRELAQLRQRRGTGAKAGERSAHPEAAQLGQQEVTLPAERGELVLDRPHPLSQLAHSAVELGGIELRQVFVHRRKTLSLVLGPAVAKPGVEREVIDHLQAATGENGIPNAAVPIATPARVGPSDIATPRTAPVIATAPARPRGGTIETM